jgi:hypothetical protein
MGLIAACLWGLSGAAAVELLDLYKAIKRTKGYPWRHADEVPLGPYLLSVVIRVALGVLAAGVCAASSQVGGPAGALAAGYAAPKLFEQLARLPNTRGNAEYIPQPREVTTHGVGRDTTQVVDHAENLPDPAVEAGDSAVAPPDGGAR